MVVDAGMHLVRRQDTRPTSAPAVATDQVVDLASRLLAPPPVEHDLAPPTRPRRDRGIFQTLVRLLTGSALLPLDELRHRLRTRAVWDARFSSVWWRALG